MKLTWKLCFCIASLVVVSTQASAESSGSLRYMEPYSVEGLGVGMPVVPNSREYRRYNCKPSEQYINSITCKFSETRGGINKIITILHLYNNIVTYINKSVYPAYFTNEDIDDEPSGYLLNSMNYHMFIRPRGSHRNVGWHKT